MHCRTIKILGLCKGQPWSVPTDWCVVVLPRNLYTKEGLERINKDLINWFNNTVNIRARNSGLYSIISSPPTNSILFHLWLPVCCHPLGWSFLHLTWALSTCNQQEGFLTQSTRATCQFVMCLLARVLLPQIGLTWVNFHSSALEISGCLPCLVTCPCNLDSLAAELCLDTSTNKLTSKLSSVIFFLL